MNESEFGRRIAAHLSSAARDIDDATAARLRAARLRALQVQRPQGRVAGLLAVVRHLSLLPAQVRRSAAAAAVLLAALAAGDYWATLSRVDILQEIDTALLIDDLPIDAYLDPDFKEWLQEDSHS